MLTNYNAKQLVSAITRGASGTTIDHLILTGNTSRFYAKTVASCVSDHNALALFEEKPCQSSTKEANFKKYILSKENVKLSRKMLDEINWYKESRESPDAEGLAEKVSKKLLEAMDYCQVECRPKGKHSSPWFDRELMALKRKCQKAMNRPRNDHESINNQEYSKLHKEYKQLIRKKKEEYYSNKFLKCSNDPKKIWNVINEVTGRKNSRTKLLSIQNEQKTLVGEDMANAFNHFYINIPKHLEKELKESTHPYSHYLKEARQTEEVLELEPITREEIFAALQQIKPKHSRGKDGLSSAFLKQVKLEIIDPLYLLFNKCIMENKWPDEFKLARVIPIYKNKGKTDQIENYRPISLLHSVSKVFERILHTRIYTHLESCLLLNENQFGFRKARSTTNAIQSITSKAQHSLAQKMKVGVCLLDISKAFDCINHDILLKKLHYYGLSKPMINLIKSYLTDRKQYMDIEGTKSPILPQCNIGVPQGSILGPLLFIIYINDVAFTGKNSTNFHITLFADDTGTLQASETMTKLSKDLSEHLEKLNDWFRSNKLTLNAKKTELIVLGAPSEQSNIILQETRLNPVESAKYLGVQVDNRLTYNAHAMQLTRKLKKINFMFHCTKTFLNQRARLNLFNALIKSNVEYCSTIWGNLISKNSMKQIEIQYKQAIRSTALARYLQHTSNICKKLNIVKLHDLIDIKTYQLHEQIVQGTLPKEIALLFKTRRQLKLRNNITIQPSGRDKLSSEICKLFNQLPNKTRQSANSKGGMSAGIQQSKIDGYKNTCGLRDCYSCDQRK